MALEFMDGFDHYSNITNLRRKWDTSAWGSGGEGFPAGRFGGNQLAVYSNQGGLSQGQLTSVATRTVGFAFYPVGVPGAGSLILQFLDSGSEQISVRYGAAGTLVVSRNGVTLGTSSLSLIAATWYYLEFQATIDPSAGAYTLKLSGVTWLSATGANTRATANSSTNGLMLGHNYSFGLDDLYVLNSAGTANNTFLGESRILTTEPSGDDTAAPGTNLLWTPNSGSTHYTRVNEGTPDDDTSFVSTSTPGQIDTYTFPAIAPTGVIAAVQVCLCERKDDAGARVTSTEYRSAAGTNYDGTNQFTLNSAYRIDRQIYEVDPATGSAWIVTGINGGEFGVKCVS